jgi:primosomal protein N' (replication factor Y)
MQQFLVDIALPVPIDRTFTYLVPPEYQPLAKAGSRVLVPFGKKKLSGAIVSFPTATTIKGLKPLLDILDAEPTFSGEMLKLTRWMSEYYFAPWGEVLKAATPQGLTIESTQHVRLIVDDIGPLLEETKQVAPKQHAALVALQQSKELTVSQLEKRTRARSIHALLHQMEQRGWVRVEETTKPKAKPKLEKSVAATQRGRDWLRYAGKSDENKTVQLTANQQKLLAELTRAAEPLQVQVVLRQLGVALSTLKSLEKKGLVTITEREVVRKSEYEPLGPEPQFELNIHQRRALERITEALHDRTYKTFLLHGITGSGKTQVYIEAIRSILPVGKTAIVLVPEISLTPQTVRRFKAHFGDDVAVMHSQMSVGERYDAWRLAHQGKIKIVIGPRSAIFAPLENIGLIVVDEEHDASYKQFDSSPRYNARDVAIVRAASINAAVILGSATPSAESYHNALSGKYEMLELPERVDRATLPQVEIVDMTRERKEAFAELKKEVKEKGIEFPKKLPFLSISRLLRERIRDRIQKRQGIILLQNRRGFSHVVECFDCGYVERCENCEVTLTYHATKKHLRCHYCGFVKTPPTVCPKCGGVDIRFHAFGTQQVQEELQELLPGARVLRMDLDTTSRKGAHDRILMQFGTGGADILLGTQMVAKGLDFPRVTLVGVISADTQMLLPDFRSSERTFQLLTQVAGRAGRSDLAGEVIIQTLQPDHYSLKHAATHDFPGFYREELEYRRELDYPPFSRIVLLEFKGEKENEVEHHAKKFAEMLIPHGGRFFTVLGPADAAIPKLKSRYRKHIIVKDLKDTDPGGGHLRSVLLKAREQYQSSALGKNRNVQVSIDVDPQGMM